MAASSESWIPGPSRSSLTDRSTLRISITLMQCGLAGEIWINSPPTLAQARWNSCPFNGAMMKTGMFFRLILNAMSCIVKVLPAPLVPRIAILAFL